MEASPISLAAVGRKYWPFFIAAWVFPIAFLAFANTHFVDSPYAPLTWMPAFFISFAAASAPGLLGLVKRRYVLFWGIVVPFFVWVIAVLVQLLVIWIVGA